MNDKRKTTVRFLKEHLDIFQTLVKEYHQADSVQDLIIDLVDYTLKNKYGIISVRSWPNFQPVGTGSYSINLKKTGKPATKINQKTQVNKQKVKKENSILLTNRQKITQSQKERPEETDPEIYKTYDALSIRIQYITDYPNRMRWEELGRVIEKNEDLIPDEYISRLDRIHDMGYELYLEKRNDGTLQDYLD